jgi:mannan endo-1,4-beta-mannosidase
MKKTMAAAWVALLVFRSMQATAQVDALATLETANLYGNMKAEAAGSLLYGQHHAYELGIHADEIGEFSDCKHICGENPAVVGFDFTRSSAWSPTGTNSDYHIQATAHFRRGGVVTFSWHADNPSPSVTGDGGVNDTTGNPVQGILTPGSQTRSNYNAMLDDIASFFNNLQIDGVHVPVIWRPLHENTGSWFWWGNTHCTPVEFQQLWQYTFDYMTHTQSVHNLLWAYSPSKPSSESHYLERYPTDPYVDLLGFDYYGNSEDAGYDAAVLNSAQVAAGLALARGKLSAMTEGGESNGFGTTARTNFFTEAWLNNYQSDPVATHLAYVLTWNSPDFSTFQEGPNAHLYPDFIDFHTSAYTVFENGLPNFYGRSCTRYEAEDAALTGLAVDTNQAGYSGAGHTTRASFADSEDQIEFSVDVPASGNYLLSIRYNSGADKLNLLDVNGINLGEPVFLDTGNAWQDHDYGEVALNAGTNAIAIRKSWGWMDVDYIELCSIAAHVPTNDFDVVFPETDVVTFTAVAGVDNIYEYTAHNGTNTLVTFYDARTNRTTLTASIEVEVPANGQYGLVWLNASTGEILSGGTASSVADGEGWKLALQSESFKKNLVLSATLMENLPQITNTFAVAEDTFAHQQYPTKTYETRSELQLRQEGASSYSRIPYLKFNVSSLTNPVARATLHIYSVNETDMVNAVAVSDNSWSAAT